MPNRLDLRFLLWLPVLLALTAIPVLAQEHAEEEELDPVHHQVDGYYLDFLPIGKVELRGSSWSAENVGAEPLAQGRRGVVAAVDGLKLHVRAQ